MKISKSVVNYAKRRNIFLEICEGDYEMESNRLWFFFNKDACEPDLSYIINEDSLTYFDTLSLSNSIKEELPATIFNEKQLKAAIDFISKEIKK